MGWTAVEDGFGGLWGFCPDAGPARVPAFTSDPAQVVPMMERIDKLVEGPIDLSPPRPAYAGYASTPWRVNPWHLKRVFDGKTANLAVGAALLAVWEAHQP